MVRFRFGPFSMTILSGIVLLNCVHVTALYGRFKVFFLVLFLDC